MSRIAYVDRRLALASPSLSLPAIIAVVVVGLSEHPPFWRPLPSSAANNIRRRVLSESWTSTGNLYTGLQRLSPIHAGRVSHIYCCLSLLLLSYPPLLLLLSLRVYAVSSTDRASCLLGISYTLWYILASGPLTPSYSPLGTVDLLVTW